MTGASRRTGAAAAQSRRWEWSAALVLTVVVAALAIVRMLHAGGLWRDEAGAVRLATLPTLREVADLFQHEAFPPLFAVTVRSWTRLTGGGDLALRALGLAVGLGVAGILWLNARTTARTLPLLSLALLGLDVPFLVFGDSLRGYGMGSALILLTYGLLARVLAPQPEGRDPSGRPSSLVRWKTTAGLIALTAITAVASVQVLVGNAALLLALCTAAAAVAFARRRWLVVAGIAGCGAAAAMSLLPYAAQLAAARRQWSVIVTYPIGVEQIWRGFIATVGPRPVLVVWLLLLIAGLVGVARELMRRWRWPRQTPVGRVPATAPEKQPGERRPAVLAEGDERADRDGRDEADEAGAEEPLRGDVAAFAALTILGVVLANGAFLEHLGYPMRPWYFLGPLALAASALDTIFGTLSRSRRGRFAAQRIAAVALVVAWQAVPLWQQLGTRQTNADLVAREVARSAGPQDLVVVLPWYFGVSFNRYYAGPAPWLTLPEIPDHRIHRYDLLKPRLAAQHPLDDVLQAVAATLRSGHRVWVAGEAAWPKLGEAVIMPPPAPSSPYGWHDYEYLVGWSRKFGRFLERHAARIATVAVPSGQPVSSLEDLQLSVVQGWH